MLLEKENIQCAYIDAIAGVIHRNTIFMRPSCPKCFWLDTTSPISIYYVVYICNSVATMSIQTIYQFVRAAMFGLYTVHIFTCAQQHTKKKGTIASKWHTANSNKNGFTFISYFISYIICVLECFSCVYILYGFFFSPVFEIHGLEKPKDLQSAYESTNFSDMCNVYFVYIHWMVIFCEFSILFWQKKKIGNELRKADC